MTFRKTRKKRKQQKRRQRGGVLFRLTAANLENYTNATRTSNIDCCPCVFKLLGMNAAEAQRLASYITAMHSFTIEDLENYFSMTYPDYSFSARWFGFGGNSEEQSKELRKIFSRIPHGYAVIGGYIRNFGRDGPGHCVAFARGADGVPEIFDAQAGQMMRGWEQILHYITEQKITHIAILRSVAKGRRGNAKMTLILPDPEAVKGVAAVAMAHPALSADDDPISLKNIDKAMAAHYGKSAGWDAWAAAPAGTPLFRFGDGVGTAGGGGGGGDVAAATAAMAASEARTRIARDTYDDKVDLSLGPLKKSDDEGAATIGRLQTFERWHQVAHPVIGTSEAVAQRMAEEHQRSVQLPQIHRPGKAPSDSAAPPPVPEHWRKYVEGMKAFRAATQRSAVKKLKGVKKKDGKGGGRRRKRRTRHRRHHRIRRRHRRSRNNRN